MLTSGSNLITDKCFYFHLLLKGNCFILQRAINEREEHAPDTCDECVLKEWRHWGGWPLWGWRSGPMIVKGDGKKWDNLYEISLGNPSDARPHYDCGHSIKAHLLLSFLFLLAALKQKIWAVTSSPPTPPPLCWGSAADTGKQSHSLACVSWPELRAEPAKLRGWKCLCVVCVYICMCAHTHACPHLSDEAQYSVLGTSCSKTSHLLTAAKRWELFLSFSFSKWKRCNYCSQLGRTQATLPTQCNI